MKGTPLPKPPRHLTAEGRRFWRRIVSAWQLDESGLIVLETTCEAFDRMRQAQADIAKHGSLVKDKHKQLKTNPAVLTERDSRQAVLRGIKLLGLDLEPLNPGPGRPPGVTNRR